MKHHCKTISDYFNEYVYLTENKERHTRRACECHDKFYKYITETSGSEKITELMEEVALEYERSGFEAGFKMASQMAMSILLAGKSI